MPNRFSKELKDILQYADCHYGNYLSQTADILAEDNKDLRGAIFEDLRGDTSTTPIGPHYESLDLIDAYDQDGARIKDFQIALLATLSQKEMDELVLAMPPEV